MSDFATTIFWSALLASLLFVSSAIVFGAAARLWWTFFMMGWTVAGLAS